MVVNYKGFPLSELLNILMELLMVVNVLVANYGQSYSDDAMSLLRLIVGND